ncbi:MAG: hypothetical protein AAB366_00015 [Patescibacteria group bacterium]
MDSDFNDFIGSGNNNICFKEAKIIITANKKLSAEFWKAKGGQTRNFCFAKYQKPLEKIENA